jgi:hypothetical protein
MAPNLIFAVYPDFSLSLQPASVGAVPLVGITKQISVLVPEGLMYNQGNYFYGKKSR